MQLSKTNLAAKLSCDASGMPGKGISLNPNIAGKTANDFLTAKAARNLPTHGATRKPVYNPFAKRA